MYTTSLVRKAGVGGLRVEGKMVRKLFGYGIRSHASTVPATLNFSLDQLIISIFLTTTQLGVYVVAVTMSRFTALIGASVAKAILPNVASQAEGPERALLSRRLVSATAIMSAIVTLPVLVAAPWLIHLFFGHGFVAGGGAARILLVAAIALSTNRALEAVLRGVGMPLDAGIAEFVALGATAAGLAIFIPLLGLNGAALTSLIAYLVSTAYMTRRATKALKISSFQLLTPDREAVAAVRSRGKGTKRTTAAEPAATPGRRVPAIDALRALASDQSSGVPFFGAKSFEAPSAPAYFAGTDFEPEVAAPFFGDPGSEPGRETGEAP
jgi:O-antigen/teichoic acid export membrane protein